jgi:hypothetical protein
VTPLLESLSACQHFIDEDLEGGNGADRIVIVKAELRTKGWLFYIQSAAFLESGSFLDALGGNSPLLVAPDGSVSAIGIDASVEDVAGSPRFPE